MTDTPPQAQEPVVMYCSNWGENLASSLAYGDWQKSTS